MIKVEVKKLEGRSWKEEEISKLAN